MFVCLLIFLLLAFTTVMPQTLTTLQSGVTQDLLQHPRRGLTQLDSLNDQVNERNSTQEAIDRDNSRGCCFKSFAKGVSHT